MLASISDCSSWNVTMGLVKDEPDIINSFPYPSLLNVTVGLVNSFPYCSSWNVNMGLVNSFPYCSSWNVNMGMWIVGLILTLLAFTIEKWDH